MLLSLTVWVVCMVCGYLIGQNKDQLVSGLVWTILLGPLGLLVVACLPNRRKEEEERVTAAQLQHTLYLAKKERDSKKENEIFNRRAAIPAPPKGDTIRVARNGEDLGLIKIPAVQAMLASGRLDPDDYFFDEVAGEWVTLNIHPRLSL